ncbi:MAG: hypothetical protein M1358_18375 [Chloroflexi bacterium]|nr:hypothetical protein [Chloroflexota bacterium]
MQRASHHEKLHRYERIVTLLTLMLIGLGLLLFIDPAPVALSLPFWSGSPLFPVGWFIAAALVLIACLGTEAIIRSYHRTPHWSLFQVSAGNLKFELAPSLWILPGMLTLGSILFLRLFSGGALLGGGLAVTALALFAIITAQYHSVDTRDPYYHLSIFALNLLVYLVAFALFGAIYVNKLRSVYSATAVLVVTALLVFQLLHGGERNTRQVAIYALIAGLILGETTWALNYWSVSGLIGGTFLLFVLYVVAGLISNHLAGTLSRRVLAEFGTVSAAGLAMILVGTFVWKG